MDIDTIRNLGAMLGKEESTEAVIGEYLESVEELKNAEKEAGIEEPII